MAWTAWNELVSDTWWPSVPAAGGRAKKVHPGDGNGRRFASWVGRAGEKVLGNYADVYTVSGSSPESRFQWKTGNFSSRFALYTHAVGRDIDGNDLVPHTYTHTQTLNSVRELSVKSLGVMVGEETGTKGKK